MTSILNEIINILVGGLTSFGQGIGSGLQSIVTSMFLDTSGASPVLSTLGGVVTVFAAISLAVGLTTLVFQWLSSLGARK